MFDHPLYINEYHLNIFYIPKFNINTVYKLHYVYKSKHFIHCDFSLQFSQVLLTEFSYSYFELLQFFLSFNLYNISNIDVY